MKRIHTLRGKVTEGTIKQLIVDDGRLTHGYRVTRFVVANDQTQAGASCFATLGLDDKLTLAWDWENNNQIAWSSVRSSGSNGLEGPAFELVDPEHVVVRDLFIRAQIGGSDPQVVNYFIQLEEMELSDWQAIVQLTKENAQS